MTGDGDQPAPGIQGETRPLSGELVDERQFDLDGEAFEDLFDDDERPLDTQLIASAPALARLGATIWWRATKWGAGASARASVRLARAAADPTGAAQVVDEIAHELRDYARDLLGISELDAKVRELMPDRPANGSGHAHLPREVALRARGARLLRTSAQLDADDPIHPAYARILTELAPDEGRILRLLTTEGAQPAVDVRAANLIGVGSDLVAGGLSMIGAEAGVTHRKRVPAYLNNLERLGLVWFSREPIDAPVAYQVLEAQPEVLAAIRTASRAKTVQRSIQLTAFGQDFCDVCLPTDTAEIERLSQTDLEGEDD